MVGSGVPRERAAGAVGGVGPGDGPIEAGLKDQADARGSVAIIGRVLKAPLDQIAKLGEGIDPSGEGLAALPGVRPAFTVPATFIDDGAGQQRAPVEEFPDVFHQDVVDPDVGGPADQLPGLGAGLLIARATSAGVRVVAAFTRGGQEIEPGRGQVERMEVFDRLAKVFNARMIEGVGVDRRGPMVDGCKGNRTAEAVGGFENAGGCAAGAAKEVNDVKGFHGRQIQLAEKAQACRLRPDGRLETQDTRIARVQSEGLEV